MDKKPLIHAAFLSFREGQWDQAIEKYRQMQELDPVDGMIANLLGDLFVRKRQVVEALQYYKSAMRLFQKRNLSSKIEMVQKKVIKLDPDSADIQEEPASAPPLDPKTVEKIEALKQAIASDPKNVEHYQKLGDLYAKAGRNLEAAEQLLIVGNALHNSRLLQKAEEVFQRILELVPNHLQAHLTLGEIYSKEGSDSDAKKDLLFVAEELIRQGNLERGQMFAQKAIQLKSIEAHYYLGLIFFIKNQNDEAQKEFDTLLKFKVNHQGGLMQLGRIFLDAGQTEEAKRIYHRLLKLDPQNAEVYEKLAEIALKKSNAAEAIESYLLAMDRFAADEQWERTAYCAYQTMKLDPKRHELYLKFADASYNAGLEQQAAEACLAIAELFASEGNPQEAARMRAKAKELTGEVKVPAAPSPAPTSPPAPKPAVSPQDEINVMMNIADNYIQQGSLDEAIEVYQKILKTNPTNEKVKNALTRVYAKFAGVNPEVALGRPAPIASATPSPAAPSRELVNQGYEKEDQRVQREARERALREAQVRVQRSSGSALNEPGVTPKSSAKENELLQTIGNTRGDEIAGDNQDEFMTVTVAEIYTKQGLLNEALKIYQKILEIEPGNLEAKIKKDELESKLAAQEQLRQQTEKIQQAKAAEGKSPRDKSSATKSGKSDSGPDAPSAGASSNNNKDNPPDNKGRRGRVSYI